MMRVADGLWQERRKNITTASILSALGSASLNRRGLEHTINADGSDFTAQSV